MKHVIKLAWPCSEGFDFLHSIISVNCISLRTPFVPHFLRFNDRLLDARVELIEIQTCTHTVIF